MYTQCPNCDTLFPLGVSQLKAAQGKVRCGHCNTVFNALQNLTEQVPEIPVVKAEQKPSAATGAPRTAPAGEQASKTPEDKANYTTATVKQPPHAAKAKATSTPQFTAPIKPEPPKSEPKQPAREHSRHTHEDAGHGDRATKRPAGSDFFTGPKEQTLRATRTASHAPDTDFFAEPKPDKVVINDGKRSWGDEFNPSADDKPATGAKGRHVKPKLQEVPSASLRERSDFKEMRFDHIKESDDPFEKDLPLIFTDNGDESRLIWGDDAPMDVSEEEEDEPPSRERGYSWLSTGAWPIGVLVLLTLLLGQYAYFMREELARYQSFRPALEAVCAVVRIVNPCEVPLMQDTARINMQNSELRPHLTVQDALLINATLINEANFIQPYPTLGLSFSDTNGATISARRFQPAEYLDANVGIEQGMPPQTPIPISLEIASPSSNIETLSWNLKPL